MTLCGSSNACWHLWVSTKNRGEVLKGHQGVEDWGLFSQESTDGSSIEIAYLILIRDRKSSWQVWQTWALRSYVRVQISPGEDWHLIWKNLFHLQSFLIWKWTLGSGVPGSEVFRAPAPASKQLALLGTNIYLHCLAATKMGGCHLCKLKCRQLSLANWILLLLLSKEHEYFSDLSIKGAGKVHPLVFVKLYEIKTDMLLV